MTPAEMVALLELERMTGMPRWQVRPEPQADPLPVIAERLRVLARDYGPAWLADRETRLREANAQIMRDREAS